jgi:ATP-dependent Clp protease ATP-binding subunit ClpA
MNPLKALRDMRTIGRLLTDAEQVARRMGDERPSAEHLLLAAMTLPDGSAARALHGFGVDADRLAGAIRDEHASALVAAGIDATTAAAMSTDRPVTPASGSGVYRSNPSAQELFQAAGAAARGARQRLAGAHVVLAAADLEQGTLARALHRLGVDRAALRAAAASELVGSA